MISKRIVLRFPNRLVDQPIVYKLVKDYNLEFNILKAYVTPREEGLLVLELKGEDEDYNEGISYLTGIGVRVQPLSQNIIRNNERCTHCGACVTICPTGALVLDTITRKVRFYDNKCIACELCVPACPPRAMEVHF
ncbi:MAG: (Fe-S)-binding protein [Armatimonadetes bacterium CG07_land_8_20_14_0_80_40_9]|nr:MAG: (Fe-S)-binding protein [Armatimonadetes bacterium CG07_land_8_20_14_0_80_40_9]